MAVNYVTCRLMDVFLILVLGLGGNKRTLFRYVAWNVMEVACTIIPCDWTAVNGNKWMNNKPLKQNSLYLE
jgi:hypothetical protein